MGWSSGSYLAEDIWNEIESYIPEADKQELAKYLVQRFEQEDADDWDTDSDSLHSVAYPENTEIE